MGLWRGAKEVEGQGRMDGLGGAMPSGGRGDEGTSRRCHGWADGRQGGCPTAQLSREREGGQTATVDGIIIFKSCMGCIFSALSSVSRPACRNNSRLEEIIVQGSANPQTPGSEKMR